MEKLLAALEMAPTSACRSCVGVVHWNKQGGFTRLEESLHPSQALCRCLSPTPHHSQASQTHSPSNLPILTVALLSWGPTDSSQPHFLLLKSLCPPSPKEESSPTVPAWIYFRCWEEIFELSTCSTTSTPAKL